MTATDIQEYGMPVCHRCGQPVHPAWADLTDEDRAELRVLYGIRPLCVQCVSRKFRRVQDMPPVHPC
jgi:hypothetical protein